MERAQHPQRPLPDDADECEYAEIQVDAHGFERLGLMERRVPTQLASKSVVLGLDVSGCHPIFVQAVSGHTIVNVHSTLTVSEESVVPHGKESHIQNASGHAIGSGRRPYRTIQYLLSEDPKVMEFKWSQGWKQGFKWKAFHGVLPPNNRQTIWQTLLAVWDNLGSQSPLQRAAAPSTSSSTPS
ncbi:hypothetical protein HD806DRAFT_527390 [Xylariaceae sp. AK1471]|nr:hypothetical protein HD806DRAFT_527390 [Xylariaceae sp. AK1471]